MARTNFVQTDHELSLSEEGAIEPAKIVQPVQQPGFSNG